jgi:hypothetical protein
MTNIIITTIIIIITNGSTARFGPWSDLSGSYSYIQSVELIGRGISSSQGRYLHKTSQTQNKCR